MYAAQHDICSYFYELCVYDIFISVNGTLTSLCVQGAERSPGLGPGKHFTRGLSLPVFTECKWVEMVGWNNKDAKEKSVCSGYFQSSGSF